ATEVLIIWTSKFSSIFLNKFLYTLSETTIGRLYFCARYVTVDVLPSFLPITSLSIQTLVSSLIPLSNISVKISLEYCLDLNSFFLLNFLIYLSITSVYSFIFSFIISFRKTYVHTSEIHSRFDPV